MPVGASCAQKVAQLRAEYHVKLALGGGSKLVHEVAYTTYKLRGDTGFGWWLGEQAGAHKIAQLRVEYIEALALGGGSKLVHTKPLNCV